MQQSVMENELDFEEFGYFLNRQFTVLLGLYEFLLSIDSLDVVLVEIVQLEEVVIVLDDTCKRDWLFTIFLLKRWEI